MPHPLLTMPAATLLLPNLSTLVTSIFWQRSTGDSSGMGCCGVVIILLIVAIIGSVSSSNKKAKAQADAQAAHNKRISDQAKAQAEAQAAHSKTIAEQAKAQMKALAQAKASYQESLSVLKSEPASADLRQRTLELGRAYSNLTRSDKGVTLFDEVALMNDINAACGGVISSAHPDMLTAKKPPIEERLAKLGELKIQGLIDEEEYNSRRQKILDEV